MHEALHRVRTLRIGAFGSIGFRALILFRAESHRLTGRKVVAYGARCWISLGGGCRTKTSSSTSYIPTHAYHTPLISKRPWARPKEIKGGMAFGTVGLIKEPKKNRRTAVAFQGLGWEYCLVLSRGWGNRSL